MSRHPLFRGAARCWPSTGLLVGGQVACRQVTPGKPGCGLPLRGHRGLGPVRASVLLSRVLTEAGVTPAVHLRGPAPLAASPAQPVSESVLAGLSVSIWAWGARHPRPYVVGGVRMDTLGHSDAPAACIVMEGCGRAGPSVVVNASRRERDAPSQHSLCTTACPGENLNARSRPVDVEMFTGGSLQMPSVPHHNRHCNR